MNSLTDKINIKSKIHLSIRKDYQNHAFISGNKLRKLEYNLAQAQLEKQTQLLTFGGAYSNHIAAVAYAGNEYNFNTIGIIRGEELNHHINENPTLSFAKKQGMQFKFISRAAYKEKTAPLFIDHLKKEFGDFYLLPEGGTNDLAVKGCEEILTKKDAIYDYICCPVGTGGTIAGIINASFPHQKIIGFPALKGDFLKDEIRKFAQQSNWELIQDYHFGGYAKVNTDLIAFMNQFKTENNIPLDPVYTGKMMFGIYDLISKGFFPENAKILAIHTGGLQGISGMNIVLKKRGLPLIQ